MSTMSTMPTGSIPPLPSHLSVPDLTETAQKVLAERYLQPDETPADLFWRVAWSVAEVEETGDRRQETGDRRQETGREETPSASCRHLTPDTCSLAIPFYSLMVSLRFLPNSPTLMNAGTDLGQLSACFVLPVSDSMEEIFEAIKQAALIHKSGGGTGFSFSRLRGRDAPVKSTNGVASGPLSFMQVFDAATNTVKQGSKRRGANMGILRVDHPDIEAFIKAKDQDGILPNFNISVGLTEDFMDAYHEDHSYPLIDPAGGEAAGRLRAREVMDLIVEHAWENGEPGVIFMDTVNAHNPTPRLGDIEATNPCGEMPLLPYESCNLGSINLSKYVRSSGDINWDALDQDIRLAVHFLDNVIDLNNYPLPEIREATLQTRKIGLGLMGWADALIKLGLPYHSDEAVELAEKVMGHIDKQAGDASLALAEQRGPYPASQHPGAGHQEPAPRNAVRTCIAPTGTLSMIADCSPGIEPLYALAQTKTCLDGTKFTQVHPGLKDVLGVIPAGPVRKDFLDNISKNGVIPHAQWFSGYSYSRSDFEVFVTAHEILPSDHLRMQAAFQKRCDTAVSKTINLPAGAGIDDVRRILEEAHALSCKGVTLYRDGSRDGQVLTVGTGDKGQGSEVRGQQKASAEHQPLNEKIQGASSQFPISNFQCPSPALRPASLSGHTHKLRTGMGGLYVTVNEWDGRPFEVFATIGQSGRSVTAKTEAIGRLVSLCLRSNISLQAIVKQLDGIIGETPQFHDGSLVKSVPDAVARILKQYLPDTGDKGQEEKQGASSSEPHAPCSMPSALSPCPDCGGPLHYQEGCLLCPACGYAKCG